MNSKANGELRQLKLISVSFKEAALDSPSFRASVNHVDDQIENIEKWLVALSSSIKKFPKYIKEFQIFSNSFLEHLVPPFIQDGLIDQEYTVQALTTTASGLKKLWGRSLASLSINSYNLELLQSRIMNGINKYRELRTRYDIAQNKYDTYLEIYLSSSKTKNPTMVMEDVVQLFHARKDYTHESLELVIQLAHLGNLLDKMLVRFNTDIWKGKTSILDTDLLESTYKEDWEKIQKIQHWCDSNSSAIGKLNNDLIQARYQVEQSSSNQYMPSTNEDDYNVSLVNSKNLLDIDEDGLEKHGYLFMKTSTDRPARQIWVKRWAFIKNGVFGLLMLSPSKKFVQESDKIGILLCKVKYAPNEDRRFCFEVKTVDTTVIFQTESLFELKSWLKVFANERRIISESNEQELVNIASGRYPPLLVEFASTANTTVDRELTNLRIVNSMGQIINSSKLSVHLERNEQFFRKYVYNQIPQIRPPFVTNTTKSAIISYSIADATSLPTALTANIWGSVNWGLYYLNDSSESNAVDNDQPDEIDSRADNFESGRRYPHNYPNELIPLDIQMRALFETAVELGEICLLSFRCICSPNSKQELSGRSFVTSSHIYFYIQSCGFISLFKRPIMHVVSVEYSEPKNYDLLKVYNINGFIKMKLFLDDGKLLQKKMMHLVNNKIDDNPKGVKGLIHDLIEIDNQYNNEKKNKEKQSYVNTPLTPSIIRSQDNNNLKQYRVDYSRDLNFLFEKSYNLPAKAVFHALLGDNAIILSGHNPFSTFESIIKKVWSTFPDGTIYRKFNTPTVYHNNKKGDLQFEQHVENMVDDEYYNFTHSKGKYAFLNCEFTIIYRIVIMRITPTTSKVFVYSSAEIHKQLIISKVVGSVCYRLCMEQAKRLDKDLKEAVRKIGTHGMIVKSIYLYGKLSQSDQDVNQLEIYPIIRIGLLDVLTTAVRSIGFIFLFLISGIFHLIANGIISLMGAIRMNYTLIFILLLSGLFNIFLIGKTTHVYWTVRQANRLADEHLHAKPMMLQRAIYLKDTKEMLESLHDSSVYTNTSESRCFSMFKNTSFVLNFDKTTYWDELYADEPTKQVAKSLKKTFQEIGVKRHGLLVKLRMLNQMEEEIGKGEWKNWLMSELQRCDYLNENLLKEIRRNDDDGETSHEFIDGVESILGYCASCSSELKNLL